MNITTEKIATLDSRCVDCFLKTYQRLFDKFELSVRQRKDFLEYFDQLEVQTRNESAPELQRVLGLKLTDITGIKDLYADEKAKSNLIATKLYDEWKPKVYASASPFDMALRLSIAGNIMDYGANQQFNIHETIEKSLHTVFAIDHSILLAQRIQEAKTILYLGDNAGEIVFDKLFIETIMHPYVTYVVKGGPVLNDVTVLDVEHTGMEIVADVISNGYDAPSTVILKSSDEFRTLFDSADLIISKGQGNLEGLIHENDPRIFFLLMVKCDVMAELIHVKKGSFVVFNQTAIPWD